MEALHRDVSGTLQCLCDFLRIKGAYLRHNPRFILHHARHSGTSYWDSTEIVETLENTRFFGASSTENVWPVWTFYGIFAQSQPNLPKCITMYKAAGLSGGWFYFKYISIIFTFSAAVMASIFFARAFPSPCDYMMHMCVQNASVYTYTLKIFICIFYETILKIIVCPYRAFKRFLACFTFCAINHKRTKIKKL